MTEPFAEAHSYFTKLWSQTKQKLAQGDIKPATIVNGLTVPVDYCISTISRISQQSTAPIAEINKVVTKFSEVLPTQFFYPHASMHISLLGCTQRAPTASVYTEEQIQRISDICQSLFIQYSRVRLSLRGVGAVGNQAFIQVYPYTREWETLRTDLEKRLIASGETPISYSNKAPIHLNFMRLTDVRADYLAIVEQLIDEVREVEIAELYVDLVELVITDFVVSSQNLHVIKHFRL